MKNKILKPLTIIPKELYVERDADRQIESIIEGMGAPGYVLEARQMGKTNLLIHTKRKMEDENNIFVFVDLTNLLDSSRGCFRNIIDKAINSHEKEFKKIRTLIDNRRKKSILPAFAEHEEELKVLLGVVPGRLVIILDEIGSLTHSSFSDEIFSQIRKIYFDRSNTPVFIRLTYILSGVAKPSEMIKDRNKSPFNIGKKIYLDDFTYDEFLIFLVKAQLTISNEIADRIFYWANGNPKITWDICSELENDLIKESPINSETVDHVVKKLYLTNFDRPPVDHIRNLVEDDEEMGNAIIKIRFNKIDIGDKLKDRLYLAGITKSRLSSDGTKIKNKVIDFCLSSQWILNKLSDLNNIADSYSQQPKELLSLGKRLLNNGKVDQAVRTFRLFIELNPYDKNNLFYLGRDLFDEGKRLQSEGRFDHAERIFRFDLELRPDSIAVLFFLGESLRRLGRLDEAKEMLERAVSINPNFSKARDQINWIDKRLEHSRR